MKNNQKNKSNISFLQNKSLELIMFGGKGGVGKTTCAAATALYLSKNAPDSSFLLVSTDPAHSLMDSIGEIPSLKNLEILEFDANAYLENFKNNNNQKLHEIASRGTFLDEEDITNLLDLSLPGLDELMSFLEISRWVEEKKYSCIIVDTAPTGHTLRFLGMQDVLSKWLIALDTMLAKHRYMKKLFSGSYHADELDIFLKNLAVSLKNMKKLLQDPKLCCFVPVTIAETLATKETISLINKLQNLKIPIAEIIINRLFPVSLCPLCEYERIQQTIEIKQIFQEFPEYLFYGIPMFKNEVRCLKSLNIFWDSFFNPQEFLDIKNKYNDKSAYLITQLPNYIQVKNPLKLPPDNVRLLLFGGKGGVGKTTLASAAALRLAKDFPHKKVFLFSTDPAHSLSDCLDVVIGSKPTQILEELTCMEIDAEKEFEEFKSLYEKEIELFFQSALHNIDLKFDKEVMEKIMDLSPPGIDELMALTVIVEFMEKKTYDIFILDSAPTGHLVRLLELPQLVNEWIKVFFGILLKYKNLFKLPNLSKRLVKLSKNLKYLRGLLNDSKQSALYGVTILTEMSFEETKDLINSCGQFNLNVAGLFLNLATPDNNQCSLCSSIYQSEYKIQKKFHDNYSDMAQSVVYRQGELRGLQKLEKLGQILFYEI